MTANSINNQIITIKAVTKEASSSREAAIAFLRKAGIIGEFPKSVKVVKKGTKIEGLTIANKISNFVQARSKGITLQGEISVPTTNKRKTSSKG